MGEKRSVNVIDLHLDALRFNRHALAHVQSRSKSAWSAAQSELLSMLRYSLTSSAYLIIQLSCDWVVLSNSNQKAAVTGHALLDTGSDWNP